MKIILCFQLCVTLLFAVPIAQAASIFKDVSSDTMYSSQIHTLAEKNIVRGTPGGYFYPLQDMNRAELLVLLYRSLGRELLQPSTPCMSDIDPTSWYASAVCDALARQSISGYADGTFRPYATVNKAEAVKMIIKVLELDTVSTLVMPTVKDIDWNAWYIPYMKAAYAHGIVPIAGQNSSYFMPAVAVKRGEFAAYLYNAISKKSSLVSSSSSVSSVLTSTRSSVHSSASISTIPTISWPWQGKHTFTSQKPLAYTIEVPSVTTLKITMSSTADAASNCTLFNIQTDGLSYEYYQGHVYNSVCTIVATVLAGSYQLQIVPKVSNDTVSISLTTTNSDRNDGFSMASKIANRAVTAALPSINTHNFHSFTVTEESEMIVSVTGADVDCLINPLKDVDLFGFSGPICNQPYTYPAGTYVVVIKRGNVPLSSKLQYTIHTQLTD